MADTYSGDCKTCGRWEDLLCGGDGECESCKEGIYYCACNQEISEHEFTTTGICQNCL